MDNPQPPRLGIDLLVVRQVAERYNVTSRTVERWIEKGLPARKASSQQMGMLFALRYLKGITPTGAWLIHVNDLVWVDHIRKPVGYPTGRPRRSKVPVTANDAH